MEINKVLICGLGALGLTYACMLEKVCELKILIDKERNEKYKRNPPIMNGKIKKFNYIFSNENFDADLIIITTKANGLKEVINNIKNFVSEKTIIISLINGISSEKIISKYYAQNILHSFYIGHSAIRQGRNVFQDGVNTIVFGTPDNYKSDKLNELADFFQKTNINYTISENIIYQIWVKFGVNICLNQLSAILGLNIGDLKQTEKYRDLTPKLLDEVISIAQKEGLNELDNYKKDVYDAIEIVNPEGKTSMLQDILAKRKTEIDIFAGEIVKLGQKYGIKTPYNDMIYKEIKKIEKGFEK